MGVSRAELREIITEKAKLIAASLGLELWGVEMLDAHRPVARIFVEKMENAEPGAAYAENPADDINAASIEQEDNDADFENALIQEAVSVEDCAKLSRQLGLAMDVDDIFPEAWVLEVSSPGLERVFFHPLQMKPYVGREIFASLRDPHPDFGDRRKFQGVLESTDENGFTLMLPDNSSCALAWEAVRKAQLIHIFPDTSKPKPGAIKKARNTGQAGGNA